VRVGIDLGTTYSLIAHLNAKGAPTLFPDLHDASAFRTPSVVHAGRGGVLVGDAVEMLLRSEPNAPIVRCAKLSMGSDDPLLRANGVDLCPTTAAALVLRKLKRDAEAFANETIESCVVCVPAQSGDAARRATRDAALAAGLPLPKLADEPVAAGVYHGLDRSGEVLLVYDLGGGTFDATVLRANAEGLLVLATEGDNALGGALMDERIVELLVADLRAAGVPDPRTDPASRERLRRFAEEAKIGLSRPGIDRVEADLKVGGAVLSFLLTQRQLESALAPYIQRTLAVTESCLRAAGVSFERVNRVLLAGGSTFMPAASSATSCS
jgi:molecular chaperone DnaK